MLTTRNISNPPESENHLYSTEDTEGPRKSNFTEKFSCSKEVKESCWYCEVPRYREGDERFVEERSVGADSWRRTGVYTFDGNKPIGQKVTYQRIQEHLQSVYKCKISYGSVIQLCVARNRRRRSAKRYKGVAWVTTTRARKGFQLRYNPDTHWSSAVYKGLNLLQFTNGSSVLVVNRDDAAGFRLDTLSTLCRHIDYIVIL